MLYLVALAWAQYPAPRDPDELANLYIEPRSPPTEQPVAITIEVSEEPILSRPVVWVVLTRASDGQPGDKAALVLLHDFRWPCVSSDCERRVQVPQGGTVGVLAGVDASTDRVEIRFGDWSKVVPLLPTGPMSREFKQAAAAGLLPTAARSYRSKDRFDVLLGLARSAGNGRLARLVAAWRRRHEEQRHRRSWWLELPRAR